jgi:hypothetical protein
MPTSQPGCNSLAYKHHTAAPAAFRRQLQDLAGDGPVITFVLAHPSHSRYPAEDIGHGDCEAPRKILLASASTGALEDGRPILDHFTIARLMRQMSELPKSISKTCARLSGHSGIPPAACVNALQRCERITGEVPCSNVQLVAEPFSRTMRNPDAVHDGPGGARRRQGQVDPVARCQARQDFRHAQPGRLAGD